jgi:hypothetical protein
MLPERLWLELSLPDMLLERLRLELPLPDIPEPLLGAPPLQDMLLERLWPELSLPDMLSEPLLELSEPLLELSLPDMLSERLLELSLPDMLSERLWPDREPDMLRLPLPLPLPNGPLRLPLFDASRFAWSCFCFCLSSSIRFFARSTAARAPWAGGGRGPGACVLGLPGCLRLSPGTGACSSVLKAWPQQDAGRLGLYREDASKTTSCCLT